MTAAEPEPFPQAARAALADSQLRANLARATTTIQARRAAMMAELGDGEALRRRAAAMRDAALAGLDRHLTQLERQVTAHGGTVHWARDAREASRTVSDLVAATGAVEVVKVKSITTLEIGLNCELEARGIRVVETDLAELICQLAGEPSSHILVPAIHRNRSEIRDLFERHLPEAVDFREPGQRLPDDPAVLTAVARAHLRRRFLTATVAISGANCAVAETGSVMVVESEGNGRMCCTLPPTLITVMGIEKVIPRWHDLAVMLQLLPRSATGERMNPYTSLWTGVTPGDGPQAFHLVLVDAGRTRALRDPVGRQALRCIRCSACLNVCPVYARTGGHAYRAAVPGPIGAILTPQVRGLAGAASLPFASTLCGACAAVCPVGIDIPAVLVHLRHKVVAAAPRAGLRPEARGMAWLGRILAEPRRYERAQRLLQRTGRLPRVGPLATWARARELPVVPAETFRQWWRRRSGG